MAVDVGLGQGDAPQGRVTFEEFLSQADEDMRAEWIDGEVVMLAPASSWHQDLCDFLTALLRLYAEATSKGYVRSAPFLMRTGTDLPAREPDVVFVSRERADVIKESYLDGPADLVVEVVSPESRSVDRGEKFSEYEAGGVREYWMIDPQRKRAEFYQLNEEGFLEPALVGGDRTYRSRVLEGLWVKIDWFWQEPLPPLLSVLKEWGIV